ncbi:MAG: YceI family protein [Acidobacteria bacterium]|nr:YceI family protein [Acidobacteriota bacterium]
MQLGKRLFATLFVVFALGSSSWAQANTWQIDSKHSYAHFSVRHLLVSNVRGSFSNVTGKVVIDESDVTKSSVEATIDATTINTQEPDRDKHLRSADFLDVANHPTITFKSKKVEKAGAGRLRVIGDLTIRGVTKQVVLEVEGPTASIKDLWGNQRRGATATTKVNRFDFGVAWNKALEAGGLAVGEQVSITIDLELTKVEPKPAAGAQ